MARSTTTIGRSSPPLWLRRSRARGGLEHLGPHDDLVSCGRREHHVGQLELGADLGKADHASRQRVGHVRRPVGAAVGDDDIARQVAPAGESPRHAGTHLAGSDEQQALGVETVRPFRRQLHGRVRQRTAARVTGAGAHRVRVKQRLDLGARIAGVRGYERVPPLPALAHFLAQVLRHQLILGREAAVEAHLVGAGLARDGVHAHRADAMAVEQVARGLEDAVAHPRLGRVALGGPGRADLGVHSDTPS